MATIGLSFYSFRVFLHESKNAEVKYIPLNDICGIDIGRFLYTKFKSLSKIYINNNDKECVTKFDSSEFNSHEVDEDYAFNSIKAIIKTGQYGIENEIIDSKSTNKTYIQKKSEATVKPFGISFYYSKNIRTGLMIVQTYGKTSVYSYIKSYLSSVIKEINNDLYVEIKNVLPYEYFSEFLDRSEVSKICLETYKKPAAKDLDELNNQNTPFDYSIREVCFKKLLIDKNSFKEKVLGVFNMRNALKDTDFVSYTNDYEEIKNIKVFLKRSGKEKCFNYNTYSNIRVTDDITNDVDININTSHPVRESLFRIMDERARSYLVILGVIEDFDGLIDVKCEKLFYTTQNSNAEQEVIEKEYGKDPVIC